MVCHQPLRQSNSELRNKRSDIFLLPGRCSEVDAGGQTRLAGGLSPKSQGRGETLGSLLMSCLVLHIGGRGGSSPATTPLWLQHLFWHSSWETLIKTSKPRNPGAKLRGGKGHILSSVLHHFPRHPANIIFSYYVLILVVAAFSKCPLNMIIMQRNGRK